MGPAIFLGLFNLMLVMNLLATLITNNFIINSFMLNNLIFFWPSTLSFCYFMLIFLFFFFSLMNYFFMFELKTNLYVMFFSMINFFLYLHFISFVFFLYKEVGLTNLFVLKKNMTLFLFSWGSNLHAFILLFWSESSFILFFAYFFFYKYMMNFLMIFFFISLWGGALGSFWALTATTPPFLWSNDWIELFTFFSYLFFMFMTHFWPKKIKNYEMLFNSFFFLLLLFQIYSFWTFHHDSSNNFFFNMFFLFWFFFLNFNYYFFIFFFFIFVSYLILFYYFMINFKLMLSFNLKNKLLNMLNLNQKFEEVYIYVSGVESSQFFSNKFNSHFWFFIILIFLPLSFYCIDFLFLSCFFFLWGTVFFFYTSLNFNSLVIMKKFNSYLLMNYKNKF